MHRFTEVSVFFVIILINSHTGNAIPSGKAVRLTGSSVLDTFPLIDTHNDLPWNLYNLLENKIENFTFDSDLSNDPLFGFENCSSCFTDLARAKKGKLGAQFWVAYVSCNKNDSVTRTIEQIDVIKRLVNKYPKDMEFVTTADGIMEAFKNKKLASLIGVEGGHSIDSKFAVLRNLYEAGARYMTLTHSCNLPWADASPVDGDNAKGPVLNLTDFGKEIVLEMNRLGMMVDLSHVSHNVMVESIQVSKAPVIFSHSSAYSVYAHHRNVQDDVLKLVIDNKGVVLVNFYCAFIGKGNVTINTVAEHINHIANVAGVDFVGIGGDYDGVNCVPEGLEDISKYPALFDLLQIKNPERWNEENLKKLAGANLIRAFKAVEGVRDSLKGATPNENLLIITERFSGAANFIKSTISFILPLSIFVYLYI